MPSAGSDSPRPDSACPGLRLPALHRLLPGRRQDQVLLARPAGGLPQDEPGAPALPPDHLGLLLTLGPPALPTFSLRDLDTVVTPPPTDGNIFYFSEVLRRVPLVENLSFMELFIKLLYKSYLYYFILHLVFFINSVYRHHIKCLY